MRFIAIATEVVVQFLNHSLQYIREELTGAKTKLLSAGKKKKKSHLQIIH